ncbi:AraC family transcriptional regulator [Pyxidicoccus parkwayensis]|uniref:AraC family transcriptional regulator n=1 Tax=Pyxidicoccus parkwayensis TaxID=2813578 RepID=A0ABX7PCB7_9BACT|nr:AraC family transcriptional regulator [Pyxidicoccus parkwaysis]
MLSAALVRNVMYRRLECGAPWGFQFQERMVAMFYVVARGTMLLEVTGEKPRTLSSGDVVFLPHGTAHVLRDAPTSKPQLIVCDVSKEKATPRGVRRVGGDGATTSLITGIFELGPGRAPSLLDRLPRVITISALEATAHPAIAALIQLIMTESGAPGPASVLVLQRLADVLLVHTLRALSLQPSCRERGLQALRDPQVHDALGLLHGAVGKPWTVATLAKRVGMSRSAFAARFHARVGEPPLQYLARWRMSRAAELLRTTTESVSTIATRVGYESLPSFSKAFRKWQGTSPVAFRRRHQGPSGH